MKSRSPQLPASRRFAGARFLTIAALAVLLLAPAIVALIPHPSSEEAIERMRELAHPDRSAALGDERGERRVAGVVTDAAGEAIGGASWAVRVSSGQTPASAEGTTGKDGRFETDILEGALQITVRKEGYAPAVTVIQENQSAANLVVRMDRGFDMEVRCTDEDGVPIAGAKVEIRRPESSIVMTALSDENGTARFTHIAHEMPANIIVSREGFQSRRMAGIRLAPDLSPLTVALRDERSARVRFVDAATGDPMEDVLLRAVHTPAFARFGTFPSWNSSGKRSDGNGVVIADGLSDEFIYTMMASWEGRRSVVFDLDPEADREITVEIPIEHRVELRIVNLAGVSDVGRIQYRQAHSVTRFVQRPEIVDDRVEVTLDRLRPDKVSIHLFGIWIEVPPLSDPITEFVIDYDEIHPPLEAEVHLSLKPARGWSPPAGAVSIAWQDPRSSSHTLQNVDVEDGKAVVMLPKGATFEVRNRNLVGGIIAHKDQRYAVESNPTLVDIPIEPAGMLRVKVLDHRGELADVHFIHAIDRRSGDRIDIKSRYSMVRDVAEWHISEPIPFSSRRLDVSANSGLLTASGSTSITRTMPVRDLVLELPEPVHRSLRVLAPDGRPYSNQRVLIGLRPADQGRPVSTWLHTNANGILNVPVSPRAIGSFEVTPESAALVPEKVPVDLLATGATIQFTQGLPFRGRIVSKESGRGVEGIRVSWESADSAVPRMNSHFEVTGSDGRFEFRNLPPARVFFTIYNPMGTTIEGDRYVPAGVESRVFQLVDSNRR